MQFLWRGGADRWADLRIYFPLLELGITQCYLLPDTGERALP